MGAPSSAVAHTALCPRSSIFSRHAAFTHVSSVHEQVVTSLADPSANIIFGAVVDPAYDGEVRRSLPSPSLSYATQRPSSHSSRHRTAHEARVRVTPALRRLVLGFRSCVLVSFHSTACCWNPSAAGAGDVDSHGVHHGPAGRQRGCGPACEF